jgi:GNAT superfamily N-acetyltransferase
LLIADDTPALAWQMITVVHPDHRGHRLGLAVKLANVDFLSERAPAVRIVQTGNAAVNEPMIAVNDMLGFEIASEGAFWQKHLLPQ